MINDDSPANVEEQTPNGHSFEEKVVNELKAILPDCLSDHQDQVTFDTFKHIFDIMQKKS